MLSVLLGHGHRSVLTRLDQIDKNMSLSKGFAGFQPVQSFNKNKAVAVWPDEDGRFLAFFHHALGKGLNLSRIECLAPLHGHIDILNRERLPLHHHFNVSMPLGMELMRRGLVCIGTCPLPWHSLSRRARHDDIMLMLPPLSSGDATMHKLTALIGFFFLFMTSAWAQAPAPSPGAPPPGDAGAADGGIADYWWLIVLAIIVIAAIVYFSRRRRSM